MTAANLVSYSAQIAVLVLACAALPRVLGLRSPGIQYLFWRTLFVICVLLPLLQPWRHELMAFVAAPSAPALLSAAATPNPASAHSFVPHLSLTVMGALLLVGVGARLAWLSAGVLRLRWMRDSATDTADSFAGLQQTIGVVADIRWSRVVRHPVTFGVVHPIVLLPMGLRTADESAQQAVVAHELHHVKRRDWAWVVGEEIVRSIFWFHPAMWWLVSRVQLARETVVDELSILTTNARRAYLDALLTFADDTGLASTPAFSARRHLFHRVMLLSKEGSMSPLRIAAGSCVLVAALAVGSWSVVRAFPLASVTVVPDVAQRRIAIRDAAIQHAVLRWNKVQKDTSLSRDERLRLLQMGILEIDHALSIDPANRDALVWKSVMLRLSATLTDREEARALMLSQSTELRDRAIALEKQSTTQPATRTTPGQLPPPPPAPSPSQAMREGPPPPPPPPNVPESFMKTFERLHPIRIGGSGVDVPKKIKDVKPIYPNDAMAARIEGEVELELIVDTDGRVADSRVVTGVPELNDAALGAAGQWEFTPTMLNGAPAAVMVRCTIAFHLR